MKIKANFLTLPLFFSAAFMFFVIACDNGTDSGPDDKVSSSSSEFKPSSMVSELIGDVDFNYEYNEALQMYPITGSFEAFSPASFVSLKFEPEGLIEYNKEVPTSWQVEAGVRNIQLSDYDARINIRNEGEVFNAETDLACGEHQFSVTACITAVINGETKEECENANGKITKPESYCVIPESSSSAEPIVWKFSEKQETTASKGATVEIGGAKFKLSEVEDEDKRTQIAIEMEEGEIKDVGGVVFDADSEGGVPVSGKEYEDATYFKNLTGTLDNGTVLATLRYYLVSFGDKRYLVRFALATGGITNWPKSISYYEATEYPEGR